MRVMRTGTIVRSQSWDSITAFYRERVECGLDLLPMQLLVERIAASGYARGVYAATSMFALCVAQHPQFEYRREMLRVEFEGGRFIFGYSESPYHLKEWRKECGREGGFGTFEHVVARLRWFMH